jgi:hypothetical protein
MQHFVSATCRALLCMGEHRTVLYSGCFSRPSVSTERLTGGPSLSVCLSNMLRLSAEISWTKLLFFIVISLRSHIPPGIFNVTVIRVVILISIIIISYITVIVIVIHTAIPISVLFVTIAICIVIALLLLSLLFNNDLR